MSRPKGMTPIFESSEDGIAYAVCKAPLYGAANGYVRIPASHPWYGKHYSELPCFSDVHELTFSGDGWIGFDVMHACDYWPGMDAFPGPGSSNAPHHWTHDLVLAETLRWVGHVKEAAA